LSNKKNTQNYSDFDGKGKSQLKKLIRHQYSIKRKYDKLLNSSFEIKIVELIKKYEECGKTIEKFYVGVQRGMNFTFENIVIQAPHIPNEILKNI
jgi:hypothetical protein